jgi:Protein of unknown function (DUF3237)
LKASDCPARSSPATTGRQFVPILVSRLDVRLVLRTVEGELIVMAFRCLRAGPTSVIEKLDQGEPADPTSYYFRMNPMFETSSKRYDWMNRIIAVATGVRLADGPVYGIFEVL